MCSEEADDSPEPELQNTRPAQTHLYFSDDSFGYDDYSEEGILISIFISMTIKKRDFFGMSFSAQEHPVYSIWRIVCKFARGYPDGDLKKFSCYIKNK